ncbi:aspartyl protease family protein [Sphingomonas sp.]|uniref:retropepsin-like aspartic protease n=1 Tax=Sphingomonas sp. TaxID=28214 RepID=UPI001B1150DB|nr:aspartyl protease family protein [Sphingomonas sp.]MBO9711546.1 aspartyl protease family protein [Sphingomonas sp.]
MTLRSSILLAAPVAALAVGGALAQQAPAQQAVPAPGAEFSSDRRPVPFELFRGNRIFLHGTVNGHPAEVMLDSGAGASVVDASFAEGAGVTGGIDASVRGMSGTIPGRMVHGTKLGVGPLTVSASVVVIDLTPISRAIGRRIDLVLGREAFDAGIVDVDFERHEIRFRPRDGFAAPAGAMRIAMTQSGPIRRVPLAVGAAAPIMADFDLGHGGSLAISQPVWSSDPAIGGLRWARGNAGGVGGMAQRRLVTLPSLSFAGQTFQGVPALLNESAKDLPMDGANIGIDLLQRFRVAVDFGTNTLWLTPNRRALAEPLPKDRLGMRMELADDRLKVVYVSPDGPGAAAGWKEGDAVVAIGDMPVTPDFYRSRYASFTRMRAGETLDLVRADGAHLPVVLRDFF